MPLKKIVLFTVLPLAFVGCNGKHSSDVEKLEEKELSEDAADTGAVYQFHTGGSAKAAVFVSAKLEIGLPVAGVPYTTSSDNHQITYTTDVDGFFSYYQGASVTFKLGSNDLVEDSVPATGKVTAESLFNVTSKTLEVTNLERLVKSIDAVSGDGVVSINAAINDIQQVVDFSLPAADFETSPAVLEFIGLNGNDLISSLLP